jgi:hypothetical protein
MDVSGLLYNRERSPLSDRRLSGFLIRFGRFGEEKNLLLLTGFEPQIV